MRREAVLLMLFTLGGCLPDKAKDLAACRQDADRFYQSYKSADPDDPKSQYVIECMADKNYDFSVSPADCDSRHSFPSQPACYVPHGWLDWSIDRLHDMLNAK